MAKVLSYLSSNPKMGGSSAKPKVKGYKDGGLVTAPKGSAPKKFDPEGSDYDYDTAKKFGMGPDGTGENKGHWGSVAPASPDTVRSNKLPEGTYKILKGRSHPTWDKGVKAEEARGSEVRKIGDRYYSVPKAK
jgi:hypothetical protein